jgi:hypothetical protein
MSGLIFDLEWPGRTLDYPEETATFAAVKAFVLGRNLTRSFSARLNTRRERLNVPTYPLALGIAQEWWTLLHETDRGQPDVREDFWARHRLDVYLRGFLFPPIALWSAGREAIAIATSPADDPANTSPIEFLERLPERAFLPRFEVEAALSDLVEATLGRLGLRSVPAGALCEAWDRVRGSLADPMERAYCEAAGRLGLDPYDPDAPDLTPLATRLSEGLFASLCEASALDEIRPAVEFATAQLLRLKDAPKVQVGAFPAPQQPDLSRHAAIDGYEAARLLRSRLGLGDDPRAAVRQLLGPAADHDPILLPNRVPTVEGIAVRASDEMRAVVVARDQGQQRFRLCRAAYLAWTAGHDVELGVTVARTRAQQASRTFGAELIAPEAFLRERAGAHGLTTDDVDDLAKELDCSTWLILDQVRNHDIGFRGGGGGTP